MDDRERCLRRFVLRIKPGATAAPNRKMPRKIFLGVHFKETSSFICPLQKSEDHK